MELLFLSALEGGLLVGVGVGVDEVGVVVSTVSPDNLELDKLLLLLALLLLEAEIMSVVSRTPHEGPKSSFKISMSTELLLQPVTAVKLTELTLILW